MGRVDYAPVYFTRSSCQRALFRWRMFLWQGLATKSMARAMFASTYIRQLCSGLPRCCLHGRSCRRDGTHLSNGRSGADLRSRPTVTHPTRPTHPTGLSELSAKSTLSREDRSLRN
jgi:hypothetical protein